MACWTIKQITLSLDALSAPWSFFLLQGGGVEVFSTILSLWLDFLRPLISWVSVPSVNIISKWYNTFKTSVYNLLHHFAAISWATPSHWHNSITATSQSCKSCAPSSCSSTLCGLRHKGLWAASAAMQPASCSGKSSDHQLGKTWRLWSGESRRWAWKWLNVCFWCRLWSLPRWLSHKMETRPFMAKAVPLLLCQH